MKLYMGFESTPYTGGRSPLPRRGKTASQKKYGQGTNTLEVAKTLEDLYGIVETFYNTEEDTIVEKLEEVFAEEIEEVMTMVKPTRKRSFISTKDTDKIEQKFRDNLRRQAYDGVIRGVPTLASLRGVSHKVAQPYSRTNPPRPSFIDTGLYMTSFRTWVEEEY